MTIQVGNEIRVRRSYDVHLRYPVRADKLNRQVMVGDLRIDGEVPNVKGDILAPAGRVARDAGEDAAHTVPRHPV